ncbi:Arylsulfatase A [Mariniphaga anaerophila]|uniref:Arylsulfatase A n=1 Tax=Mariniphaga anaerophila TaxID=1484053 RepID=A0A1M5DHX2_9BACT|nr:sulfatase [Mariniphaga anaerophila]SHF66570.1 Arylsulfatase A [Mariniphaga anaerophila]
MSINRIFLATVLVTLINACTPKDTPPNFVVILVDDLGWADVKCNFPESFYDTPNIDKLATHGVRFTNAYSASPVCSPTRAAIMTGKHPNRVEITDWIPGQDPKNKKLLGPQDRTELALEEITLAEKMKEAGYITFFAGKWHLGDEGFLPENQGFDINIGGHHKGSPPGGYYSPYNNPKLTDGPEGEYLTDRLTDESIRFLKQNKENPFLLFLSFYTVHTPIEASKKFIQNYQKKRETLGLDSIPHKKEGEGWTKLLQEDAAYASMVAAMDENVGRLLNALSEQNLDENTWVIFTSDNGGLSTLFRKNAPTANGPLRAGKGWCYEGGIRVPLIIDGPKISSRGSVSEQPVISMDFFTTILSIAGIQHQQNDGVNLLPVLTGDSNPDRDAIFWHFPHYHGSAWTPGSAIRKGDWKLVLFYEDQRTELFNLAEDPGETNDISKANPEKAKELKTILDKKLKESGAKFPVVNR